VQSGRLKLLGVGSPQRLDAFPDTQTLAEAGPGLQSMTWMAFAAPPGTPKEITDRISRAIGKIVASLTRGGGSPTCRPKRSAARPSRWRTSSAATWPAGDR
jgi:hypothetical protein